MPKGFVFFWQPMQHNLPTCTLLVLQWKDPVPSAWKIDIAVGLVRCHMMHLLEQNKRAHTERETGKDIPTHVKKPGTGCVGSLSLGKEYSRPKAHSYVVEWGKRLCS